MEPAGEVDASVVAQAPVGEAEPVASAASDGSLIAEELLVEDVSIDGMCGVY